MKLIILNKNENVIQNKSLKLYLRIIKKDINDIILDENDSITTTKYKLYQTPIIINKEQNIQKLTTITPNVKYSNNKKTKKK